MTMFSLQIILSEMYKNRVINGFSQRNQPINPISLQSLLRTYVQSTSLQKSYKDVIKSNSNIENIDNIDEAEFNGLIKGLKVNHNKPKIIRKTSLQALETQQLQQKKNMERPLRPKSKKTFVAKNKISIKVKIFDNKIIKMYFRYQLISLFNILNRREDYLNMLKGKRIQNLMPLKNYQVQEVFGKLLDSKGKDKGRVKFNHMTNEQLRNLKYKAKPLPTANLAKKPKIKNGDYVDDSGDQIEQQEYKEENIDMATWKKRNGCGYNQKVFIVKGGYHELRRTLTEKGWFQNQDVYSQFYDLRWTTQTCDIDYGHIKQGQIVNHFNNNHHLTSKYGLARRLKTLIISHGIDIDKFYPRSFDLGDQVDFQNFIENFKYSFAQSVVKRFLVDKDRYKGLQIKIRVVYDILKRRLVSLGEHVNNINNGIFTAITSEEWQIITETFEFDETVKKQKLQKLRQKDSILVTELQQYQRQIYAFFDQEFRIMMEKLGSLDPQLEINGFRNVWIAKPNFLSRGRGIKCLNNLYDIANYCLGKDCQFVIQKYIQNPLLLNSKKFDIRQWVLIQDFNPPTIWFYEECYIRLCCDDYSLDNINNKFMHLTNNSIQKYNKNFNMEEGMWEMKTFIEYVGMDKWKAIQDKMKSIIVWSIKSCEGSVTGKKGFFQMVGYDFMIDQNLNPWLIEINMSPSMDHSTPVTTKLVKMVQRDMGNILASSAKKKQKNAGLFTCIYKTQADLSKFNHYT